MKKHSCLRSHDKKSIVNAFLFHCPCLVKYLSALFAFQAWLIVNSGRKATPYTIEKTILSGFVG